ncbi:hypothetical protein ABPG72_016253 [Tetrahymena utriculariae]
MEEEQLQEDQDYNEVYKYPFPDQQEDPTKGRMFLSGKEVAFDINFIRNNYIKAVLTLTSSSNPKYKEEDNIQHMMIDIEDNTAYDISGDFNSTFEFIDENLQKGNLLIHCEKGVSRSPTIAIAYIMRKERKILSYILAKMKEKRKVVQPNGGFMFHLETYNKRLIEKYKEEYDKHNQKKPTHQHNENCSKILAQHYHSQKLSSNQTNDNQQQQLQGNNSQVSETLENPKQM